MKKWISEIVRRTRGRDTADAQGISTHIVPEGIIIQTSQGQTSLFVTHVQDLSGGSGNHHGAANDAVFEGRRAA